MQATTGSQPCHSRAPEQVWLPGLQVWAAVGNQPVLPASGATGNKAAGARSTLRSATSPTRTLQAGMPVWNPCSERLAITEVLPTETHTSTDDTTPTCPICRFGSLHQYVGGWHLVLTLCELTTAGLTEIVQLQEKAVLSGCMHVFCVACISRWASKKRVCPLCKVSQKLFQLYACIMFVLEALRISQHWCSLQQLF